MQTYSLNKVILIGRLGANPVGRYTKKGQSTCSFSIATNEKWKNKKGGWSEHVEWHSIVAWGTLADFASSSLEKGQLVEQVTHKELIELNKKYKRLLDLQFKH